MKLYQWNEYLEVISVLSILNDGEFIYTPELKDEDGEKVGYIKVDLLDEKGNIWKSNTIRINDKLSKEQFNDYLLEYSVKMEVAEYFGDKVWEDFNAKWL